MTMVMESPTDAAAHRTGHTVETATGTVAAELLWTGEDDACRSECGTDARLTWERR